MADERNEKTTQLEDEAMKNVAGGWAGYDKYTKEEYALAGVTWAHFILGADRYFYKGEDITQEEAERITDEWFRTHGQ